jgi:hypothetical protein
MTGNTPLALGCEPTPQGTTGLPRYAGAAIPRSEWRPVDVLRKYAPRGKCQFNLPACCTYTQLKQFQTLYAFACDGYYPEVSYAAMHQEVTGGRMQQGARPVDTMRLATTKGIVPASAEAPEFFTSPRRFSGAGRELLVPHEQEELFTLEELVSSILNLEAPNVCLDWRERDANPGPSGECVMDAGRLLGGHSVLAVGVRFDYRHSPSGIGVLIQNHHGDKLSSGGKNEFGMVSGVWGDDGFGWIPAERLVDGAGKYTSTTLRTVKVLDKDLKQ